ncbi:MAG: hypothetical protein M1569_01550 [Candidatus Marsarchaeota archaeon]|nr:hypothetical protein [Candidatus Marsarchaeota archaeon]MCL5413068.1 hypothetical protein [Candidatus Marsarchaeota archaeon]
MAKQEIEVMTDKALRSGGMLCRLYFDMQSEKQEDLQPLMTDLVNNRLLKAPGVLYCFGSIDEPIKLKDVYSTNAIVTVLFNDLGAVINVVFNLSPVGIDVLKPEGEYIIKSRDLTSVLVSLSQISSEYSKYILTKVLSGEELEKVKKDTLSRAEQGKRLLEKEGGSKGADQGK